jgi:hypothetical protein
MVLWLIVVFQGIEIGGGFYEWRCIYPLWSKDPKPQDFNARLAASGQELAGRRFWPFISPVVLLLSLLNIAAAYQSTAPFRTIWLVAGAITLLNRMVTFAYFVPALAALFSRGKTMAPDELSRRVRRWVRLSPLRIPVALISWVGFIWVLSRAV